MDPIAGTSLVEQQIKRWELARREAPREIKPCVAMSRLPGTPAAELGRRLAERLDYGFFGIELVDEIARARGVHRHLVAQLDEHVRTGLDRWLLDTFRSTEYTEKEYLHNVGRIIGTLAEKGAAVILGRGAPFLLTPDRALRVLVVASRANRLERLARAKRMNVAEAERALTREEEERMHFLTPFVPDPDDPLHFDLVVNTEHHGADFWTEVLVGAVAGLPAAAAKP